MDMGFGAWNVNNLYRAGSQVTVSKDLSGTSAGGQMGGSGTKPEGEFTFIY
jgi:hypothetical protein